MAMVKCPKCEEEISDKAKKCIHCGKVFEENTTELNEMICEECGNAIPELSKECPNCGCPVSSKSKFKFKLTKKVKIILCSIIGAIVIACIGTAIYNSTPVQNYVAKVEQDRAALKASEVAFKEAEEAEKNSDYELAIEKYRAVIKKDKSYDKAQKKIEELKEKYKIHLLSEAENYTQNKKYTKAIQNVDKAISILGSSDELVELKQKYENLAESYNEGFDEVVDFIMESGSNHDGIYYVKTSPFSISDGNVPLSYGGFILGYDSKSDVISLSRNDSYEKYSLTLVIDRNKTVEYTYIYDDNSQTMQMRGKFDAGKFTENTEILPYHYYNGHEALKGDFNELAVLDIKRLLDEIGWYGIAETDIMSIQKKLGFELYGI